MSTIEECHLTNEKNPPKMLNYAKRRLSHAGFEMTQQPGAWWCVVVAPLWLRVTDVVRSSECEGVRQRQSLTQPVSPQTGFPLLGQLASSQSHTKCFDSLFSTQRNCPVLTTDVAASGPLTKESADFPIDFLCIEGAVRGVCVH